MAVKNIPLGVILFVNDDPAGWCSVAPREQFIRLEESRVLKPIDEKKVWSLSCLFVNKKFRRKGLSSEIIKGAVEFAKKNKAKIVEAYPTEPKDKNFPDTFAWTGIYSAFIKAGFEEVARHSPVRPILRFYI
jgi:GNAT superfamily N-acetyltransferase